MGNPPFPFGPFHPPILGPDWKAGIGSWLMRAYAFTYDEVEGSDDLMGVAPLNKWDHLLYGLGILCLFTGVGSYVALAVARVGSLWFCFLCCMSSLLFFNLPTVLRRRAETRRRMETTDPDAGGPQPESRKDQRGGNPR